jgi:hypothetical protein
MRYRFCAREVCTFIYWRYSGVVTEANHVTYYSSYSQILSLAFRGKYLPQQNKFQIRFVDLNKLRFSFPLSISSYLSWMWNGVDICEVRIKHEFSSITFSVRSSYQTRLKLAVHIYGLLMVFVLFIANNSYTVKYVYKIYLNLLILDMKAASTSCV